MHSAGDRLPHTTNFFRRGPHVNAGAAPVACGEPRWL
jgi:hypothetical protein